MSERRPRLRRAAYLAAVTMSSAAFVFSLTGIATTQGHIKPNGDAAAAVKRLQEQQRRLDVRDCHRHQSVATTSQREV
jgi:hypothetical protein